MVGRSNQEAPDVPNTGAKRSFFFKDISFSFERLKSSFFRSYSSWASTSHLLDDSFLRIFLYIFFCIWGLVSLSSAPFLYWLSALLYTSYLPWRSLAFLLIYLPLTNQKNITVLIRTKPQQLSEIKSRHYFFVL